MRNLAEFNNDLDEVIDKLGMNSIEVQSLKILLSNSLYVNESEATSIVLESTPTTCLLLNSSISHACGKGYSVYRGLNPRARITNLTCTETKSVRKYDEFLSIQGYKLVYANNYDFVINNVYDVDVILTKSVNSGYFISNNKVSYNITNSDISEDFYLYTPTSEGSQEIELNKHINLLESDEIGIVTIPDFGVKLLSLSQFNDNRTYYYKYIPYITELINLNELLSSVDRIPSFELPQELTDPSNPNSEKISVLQTDYDPSNPDSYTMIQRLDREENKDLIYIKSISDKSNVVRATNSLNEIIYNYISPYVNICKSIFEFNGNVVNVNVYYQLKDGVTSIPLQVINDLMSFVKVSYYNSGLNLSIESFNKAIPYEFSGVGIEIHYKSTKDHYVDIITALKSLQGKYLGGEFNINMITSCILKISSDIEYVNLVRNGVSESIDLGSNLYPDLIKSDNTLGSLIKSIGE